jgi:hypothetical protein
VRRAAKKKGRNTASPERQPPDVQLITVEDEQGSNNLRRWLVTLIGEIHASEQRGEINLVTIETKVEEANNNKRKRRRADKSIPFIKIDERQARPSNGRESG